MHRIAIVDDNETWCFVLALRLQQQGYAVSSFTNAQAFLREADQFDLVLIDFSIPAPRYQRDMDGPEVICQVKRQLDNPPVLVLISGFFTNTMLRSAATICPEADAIFSKQVELNDLFAHIRRLLSGRSQFGQSRRVENFFDTSERVQRTVSQVNRPAEQMNSSARGH
jgi:DNA-binding response OmpR family regulator